MDDAAGGGSTAPAESRLGEGGPEGPGQDPASSSGRRRETRSRRPGDETDPMEPLAFRPEIAAELLGISRSQVFKLIAAGELPSITIGRSRRIPRDALLAWIRARTD